MLNPRVICEPVPDHIANVQPQKSFGSGVASHNYFFDNHSDATIAVIIEDGAIEPVLHPPGPCLGYSTPRQLHVPQLPQLQNVQSPQRMLSPQQPKIHLPHRVLEELALLPGTSASASLATPLIMVSAAIKEDGRFSFFKERAPQRPETGMMFTDEDLYVPGSTSVAGTPTAADAFGAVLRLASTRATTETVPLSSRSVSALESVSQYTDNSLSSSRLTALRMQQQQQQAMMQQSPHSPMPLATAPAAALQQQHPSPLRHPSPLQATPSCPAPPPATSVAVPPVFFQSPRPVPAEALAAAVAQPAPPRPQAPDCCPKSYHGFLPVVGSVLVWVQTVQRWETMLVKAVAVRSPVYAPGSLLVFGAAANNGEPMVVPPEMVSDSSCSG